MTITDPQQTTEKSHIVYYSQIQSQYHKFFAQLRATPVECEVSSQDPINYNTDGNTDELENCDLYETEQIVGKLLYKCIRCKLGYTGVAQNGYIECDTKITNCSTTKEILNLLSPYNADILNNKEPLQIYNSCSYCLNNKIPVIYMSKKVARIEWEGFQLGGDDQVGH